MTLKARNIFILVLSSVFLALSAAALAYYVYKLNPVLKGRADLGYGLSLNEFSLFSSSAWALVFESAIMAVYIPAAAFTLYARFEKTPSNEAAYFTLFLLGCVPELSRLSVPIETIQRAFPGFLELAGRALFWGRTLLFTSLFASSLLPPSNKTINVDKRILMLLFFSLAIASAAPINTIRIPNSFCVQAGWPLAANAICALAGILTIASCAENARSSENPLFLKLGIDIICVEAGFVALNSTAILAPAVLGAVLLCAGTTRYLSHLHRLYS